MNFDPGSAGPQRRAPDGQISNRSLPLNRRAIAGLALAAMGAAALLEGQPASSVRPSPLTVLSRTGRDTLPVATVDGHEMVSLDDLARLFDLTVREDTAAGGLTISHRQRVLVLSATRGLASVGGRVFSLPAAPARSGPTWLVPVELLARALPAALATTIELRRASRLVVVGDLRVPRVAVRQEGDAQQTRVHVEISPPTEHVVSQEAGRLLVKFQADALDATIGAAGTEGLVQGVRVVETASLAIELGPRFGSYTASATPREPDATRLVIDVRPPAGLTAVAPQPAQPAPGPATSPPPAIVELPTTAVRTIVLDPGHGGDEEGAKGPGGTLEKNVALAVARQLKAVIEARLGLRVLLTRDADQTVPLDERAAIANNNKADLFISLHANASVRGGVTGAEVFYLSLDEYGLDARRIAEAEGEAVPLYSGGQRAIDLILWEMAQARHLEDSAILAALIEEQLRARVAMSARAIQQAPFRVLVGANMPAVLVEMGFITNPDEEKKLNSPQRQTEIVQALYESIVRFRTYLESGRRPAQAQAAPPPPTPEPARPAGPGGRP